MKAAKAGRGRARMRERRTKDRHAARADTVIAVSAHAAAAFARHLRDRASYPHVVPLASVLLGRKEAERIAVVPDRAVYGQTLVIVRGSLTLTAGHGLAGFRQ